MRRRASALIGWRIAPLPRRRSINPLWWLGLIAGIVMTVLAFWTEGQFFIDKAYVLLVFAGIWALMQGITTIVRAAEIRRCAKSCNRQRRTAPGATRPSSRARATASLRVCASSLA